MSENLIQNSNISFKSKVINFYKERKKFIYLTLSFLIIIFIFFGYYLNFKEKEKLILSEKYVKAKIYLSKDNKEESKKILKELVFANSNTYSTLSLFLILSENLIKDNDEVILLFDHVLKNNNFEEEIKNLIIFKKALFLSSFTSEEKLLESIKSLTNNNTMWKPHALLLLGDYFFMNNQYNKSKEFYAQILEIKNLNNEFYEHAKLQLIIISNE
ncbi:hypothetical protein OAJ47_00310 [bacterium]|nr:hypothetical protein [bacterium]